MSSLRQGLLVPEHFTKTDSMLPLQVCCCYHRQWLIPAPHTSLLPRLALPLTLSRFDFVADPSLLLKYGLVTAPFFAFPIGVDISVAFLRVDPSNCGGVSLPFMSPMLSDLVRQPLALLVAPGACLVVRAGRFDIGL